MERMASLLVQVLVLVVQGELDHYMEKVVSQRGLVLVVPV